ncbi:hypothetical protein D3C84_778530 [compost metagenome]
MLSSRATSPATVVRPFAKWSSAAWAFRFLRNGYSQQTWSKAECVACWTITRPRRYRSAPCSVVNEDVRHGRWRSSIFSVSTCKCLQTGRRPALVAATGTAVGQVSCCILLQPFLRTCPNLASKGTRQRRRTFVTDLIGNQGDGATFPQALLRQTDSPVRQVIRRSNADDLAKVRSKARARHARAVSQFRHGPIVPWFVVNTHERAGQLSVSQPGHHP